MGIGKLCGVGMAVIALWCGAFAHAQQAPRPAMETPGMELQRNGGSLLRASMVQPTGPADSAHEKLSAVGFFAVAEQQPKTIKKHDLVTIIVSEQTQMTTEGKTETTKDQNTNMQLQQWIALNTKAIGVKGNAQGANPPGVAWDLSRNLTADAKADRSDSLTLRVSAEVIDVKPNGMLVMQGTKYVKTDDEEQNVTISGTCRVEDVGPDNTVLSTQLGDLHLVNDHKGAIRDATNRGFITKLLDTINPF